MEQPKVQRALEDDLFYKTKRNRKPQYTPVHTCSYVYVCFCKLDINMPCMRFHMLMNLFTKSSSQMKHNKRWNSSRDMKIKNRNDHFLES